MGEERAELARVLNEARLNRHLSIRAAARVAGVPTATMQGWLSGNHFPTPALRPRFQALLDFLELPEEVASRVWAIGLERMDLAHPGDEVLPDTR